MSYQSKPNSGAIFKNDKKEKESHPDYTGSINVEGKDFRIALWVKDGNKGKFFSASISEKTDTGYTPPKTTVKQPEDDLPF